MLTIWKIAVAQKEGMKGRPCHRRRSRGAALERLEGRSLLSALAPVRSTNLELPDVYPVAAEVDSSAGARAGDRSSPGETVASVPDDSGRTERSGGVDVVSSPPGERVHSGAAGSSRRFNSQEIGSHELLEPLFLVSRSLDVASTSLPGDAQTTSGLELIAGLGGGDSIDTAGAASLVGRAPGTATPATLSLANPSGRGLGPDGRAGPGNPWLGVSAAGGGPMDSVGLLVPEAGIFGPTPGDDRPASDLQADVDTPLALVANPDRGGRAPAWADILESALHPDWEAVDGEMRQFLSRLVDLDRTAVGQGAGPAWLLCIGVATMSILASRASYDRWLWIRRAGPWSVGVSGRHPFPVGPWPLGPP